jgi:hypothetical protein
MINQLDSNNLKIDIGIINGYFIFWKNLLLIIHFSDIILS